MIFILKPFNWTFREKTIHIFSIYNYTFLNFTANIYMDLKNKEEINPIGTKKINTQFLGDKLIAFHSTKVYVLR